MQPDSDVNSMLHSAEVHGTVLLGFLQACTNLHIIAQSDREHLSADVEAQAWYPIETFCQFQTFILREFDDARCILEQAGIEFVTQWLEAQSGAGVVQGGLDFLALQTGSEGYACVVRGSREAVGSFDLLELDLRSGHAVVESSTPFSRDFERGVLTGGMLAGGSLWYVAVRNERDPNRFMIEFRPSGGRATQTKAIPEPDLWTDGGQGGEFVDQLYWRYQGALHALRRERSFWHATNATLERFADRLQMLSRQMEDLAHRDSLTGVPNRRGILQLLEREFSRSVRYGLPLCVIILDLDWFKRINDSHGHLVGDQVLERTAGTLAGALRMSDTVGRLSGEEFLVLLPGDGLEEARVVAEKLRHAVARQTFLGQQGPFRISASFGVAAREGAADAVALMRHADEALYRAKAEGRNLVRYHRTAG